MGLHDRSYRLLFSEPRLIEDLIRGFFPDPWVDRLDFTTLERVNASYVAPSLKAREDDMVWKLRFRNGRPVYIYLLLEFQSTADRFMSVRMMGYEALLLQHLIKEGQLTPDGLLPLVIPAILYNGEEPWWPPLDVADLIERVDPEADQFRPRLKCRLIDESRYSLEDLAARQNLVAVLFWLEKTTDPADVQRGIARLVERLGDDPAANSLRRAFAVWLNVVRLPGTGLTEEEIPEILGLEDFKNMMEQQVERWNRVLLDKGRQEGLQAGRQEGLQEGLRAGEARLVLRQLEEKFGVLDARSRERIQTADADQLLEWGARLMKAHRLRDVFGD
jgi:predicted transposase/invertase (TIGR01784 family)